MSEHFSQISVCLVGSNTFCQRFARSLLKAELAKTNIISAQPEQAKDIALSERPNIVAIEISPLIEKNDLIWTREFLSFLRERYDKDIYIIIVATSVAKIAYAGDLLFDTTGGLDASDLIDNLVISPPTSEATNDNSIEQQLINCIESARNEFARRANKETPLPTLWDDCWVPAMCDPASREVWMRWLPRYASYVNENPIIVGPTGAGKTRLAKAIHYLSGRKGPFVSITPRDFSSSELIQAELFGSVAGAYTGAIDKWGLVKSADKGTLFIDELQSIDLDLQGKLITFIENKTYRRVGESESHQADVRFVFATNKSLQELVDTGRLRDDFAYRLERLKLVLPPLSERKLDIIAATAFALAKIQRERLPKNTEVFTPVPTIQGISEEVYELLYHIDWPGNLRQLENAIAQLAEHADMDKKTVIDKDCATKALGHLLGQALPQIKKKVEKIEAESSPEPELSVKDKALIEETVSKAIADQLDSITEEAVEISMRWLSEDES